MTKVQITPSYKEKFKYAMYGGKLLKPIIQRPVFTALSIRVNALQLKSCGFYLTIFSDYYSSVRSETVYM